jgi:hypothetical protein
MKPSIKLLAAAAVAAALASSSAFAGGPYSIPVANADFATLPPGGLSSSVGPSNGGGTYAEAPIPGWSNSGASGQFDPTGGGVGGFSVFSSPVPGGSGIVAFTNNGDTLPITQTVGATAVAGGTYTLSVYIGEWNTSIQSYSYGSAVLDIGGVDTTATGTAPGSGGFSLYTASFTATALQSGDPITIELFGPSTNCCQGDFADVSLTTSVPEPATWALILAGVGGVGGMMRRTRRTALAAA